MTALYSGWDNFHSLCKSRILNVWSPKISWETWSASQNPTRHEYRCATPHGFHTPSRCKKGWSFHFHGIALPERRCEDGEFHTAASLRCCDGRRLQAQCAGGAGYASHSARRGTESSRDYRIRDTGRRLS